MASFDCGSGCEIENIQLSEDDSDEELRNELSNFIVNTRQEIEEMCKLQDKKRVCFEDVEIEDVIPVKRSERAKKLSDLLEQVNKACDIIFSMRVTLHDYSKSKCKEKSLLLQEKEKLMKMRSDDNKPVHSPEENKLHRLFFSSFFAPYFKDEDYFPCGNNSDVAAIREDAGYVEDYRPWSVPDYLNLEHGVRMSLVQNYVTKLDCDVDKKHVVSITRKIKNNPMNDFLTKEMEKDIDWQYVADSSKCKFNGDECARVWFLVCRPLILKQKWSKTEVKNLIALIRKYGKQDWDAVAQELGTDRSGLNCYMYFLNNLFQGAINGKWSKEEENDLIERISLSKIGGKINWNRVMYGLEYRTFVQVVHKWTNSLDPDLNRGYFTPEEDELLLKCIKYIGTDFGRIAKKMKCRSVVQIRNRYKDILRNEVITTGAWSLNEDQLLLSLVEELGESKWKDIAARFITRTRVQIRQRYKHLKSMQEKDPSYNVNSLARHKRTSFRKRKVQSSNLLNLIVNNIENNGNKGKKRKLKCKRKKAVRRKC